MKLVIQRVTEASVSVDSKIVGEIHNGFLVLLGIKDSDTEQDVDYLVKKLINLRIFNDDYYIQQAPELSYLLSQTS